MTCLGEPFFVAENDVFLGDMGVHARADGFRVCISQVANEEIVSCRERRLHVYEVFSRTERNSDARGHLSVSLENSLPHCWIPDWLRNMVTMTVMKASLMLE